MKQSVYSSRLDKEDVVGDFWTWFISKRPLTVSIFGNSLSRIPHGVVSNVYDYNIVVIEFELHSRDNVHFWANDLEKVSNHIISFPANG